MATQARNAQADDESNVEPVTPSIPTDEPVAEVSPSPTPQGVAPDVQNASPPSATSVSGPASPASPATPSSPSTAPQANETQEVFPIAHCWVQRTINTTTRFYAIFGYEATTNFTSAPNIYNITGGYEYTEPIVDWHDGIHALTIMIESSATIVTLSFADQFTPSVNGSAPAYFPDVLVQSLNISNEGQRCPNSTLDFTLNYPSSTSSNLTGHVRQLLSQQIPYPIDLISATATSNSTSKRATLATGGVAVSMRPSETFHPYYSYTLGIGGREAPSDAETGAASGLPVVTSKDVPYVGGEPTPDELPPPPGLNSFAKGAIAICVIVGVLIVGVSIALVCLSKDDKLPTTTKGEQSKAIRRRRKRERDIEKGEMSVPLSKAAVVEDAPVEESGTKVNEIPPEDDTDSSDDEEEEIPEEQTEEEKISSSSSTR